MPLHSKHRAKHGFAVLSCLFLVAMPPISVTTSCKAAKNTLTTTTSGHSLEARSISSQNINLWSTDTMLINDMLPIRTVTGSETIVPVARRIIRTMRCSTVATDTTGTQLRDTVRVIEEHLEAPSKGKPPWAEPLYMLLIGVVCCLIVIYIRVR